jgi:riboflavin kinase/FMN adenylyltransferase
MTEARRVIALGFFDGIHIGHAALINKAKEIAREQGTQPAVLTFDMHPDTLVLGAEVPLINSPFDRKDIIRRLFGVTDIIFVHFDEKMMKMPWEEFIDRLVADFNVTGLVAGHDFRFGYKGKGNTDLLQEKCKKLGIECQIINEVELESITVSSTFIRKLISEGDIERANRFLGHPHVLTDIVCYGHTLGTSMGFPTINMCFTEGVIIPSYGVYATKVQLQGDNRKRLAVTNIGVRPTLGGTDSVTAESYIIDYSGDLYGQRVRVEFFKMLRQEQKFPNIDELKAQIDRDVTSTRKYFDRKRK